MKPLRVVVVGAGVAGLACAQRLKRASGRALELFVLEAQDRAGGHVHTIHDRGFTVEGGPNAFLDRVPEARALIEELGLAGSVVEARPAAARRYVLRRSRLRRVPDGPAGFLRGDALSPLGKARMLLEPWARRAPAGREETVEEFARRRVGREAAAVLVDAAVAGVSAGDPRTLSLPAAFPLMDRMEKEHGSLVRALLARRRTGAKPARLLSFADGMSTAIDALARELAGALRTSCPVRALEASPGGWRLKCADGSSFEADHVVCALPGAGAARLIEPLDPDAAALLSATPFASVAVVGLGFAGALPPALDGYGYLVPRGEHMTTLGVVHDSAIFPGRAPAGGALVRVILGGPRDPAIAARPDDALVALALRELRAVVGDPGEPVGTWVFRRSRAIAQYVPGHKERTARARARLERLAGLHLCGTSYDGISFGGAIASGRATADRVLVGST